MPDREHEVVLSPAEEALLGTLAEQWGCTRDEAIARIIRQRADAVSRAAQPRPTPPAKLR